MRIYVASSWRNMQQPEVVAALRQAGHDVYDFKNPRPGDNGFHWSEIDGGWKSWTLEKYRCVLDHPIARSGFSSDWEAMRWADACVLVLPCGRSAHIEAGCFVGWGKPLYILLDIAGFEPELMYRMAAGRIVLSIGELIDRIRVDEADGPGPRGSAPPGTPGAADGETGLLAWLAEHGDCVQQCSDDGQWFCAVCGRAYYAATPADAVRAAMAVHAAAQCGEEATP